MRALAAFAVIALAIIPAQAQKLPPINILQDKSPDARTVQRHRDIEGDYNNTMKKIPDRKKESSDPWKTVRPDAGKAPDGSRR